MDVVVLLLRISHVLHDAGDLGLGVQAQNDLGRLAEIDGIHWAFKIGAHHCNSVLECTQRVILGSAQPHDATKAETRAGVGVARFILPHSYYVHLEDITVAIGCP